MNVGGWEFTFPATSLNAGYQMDDDDAYLYFGIWVSEPVSVTGIPDFEYIAGGGADSGSDLNKFNSLTGPATFTGGAVGKYATVGQVGQQNAKIGTFTATATFTANLGTEGGTPAAAAAGNLHGQLTDFREGGTSLAGWHLTLGDTGDVGDPADHRHCRRDRSYCRPPSAVCRSAALGVPIFMGATTRLSQTGSPTR